MKICARKNVKGCKEGHTGDGLMKCEISVGCDNFELFWSSVFKYFCKF